MQDESKDTAESINWKAIAEMQARLIKEKFNIDLSDKLLPVSDGCVHEESMVWWKSEDGPERVCARNHWINIRNFPQFYSVNEPRYTVTYLD